MPVKGINSALNKLASYKQDASGRWGAAGLALSVISDGYKDMGQMAYNYFEAHNYHAVCSVLNWMFNLYDFKHQDDLNNIKWMFENHQYEICVSRNDDGSWNKKKYRAKITFEEVE